MEEFVKQHGKLIATDLSKGGAVPDRRLVTITR